MLKNTLLLVSIILVSTAIVFSAYILKDKDICCGISMCRNLTDICGEDENNNTVLTSSKGTQVIVENIKGGDTIANGTEISGKVKGVWYFEGTFPVLVLDSAGNAVSSTSAMAQGEWTTDEDVLFKVLIDLPVIQNSDVVIVFKKSNPSGLEENDDSVSIPVKIAPNTDQTQVRVFFPNAQMNSMEDCSKVYGVTRVIPKVTAIARVSMEQLFAGPTESEKEDGYFTNINEGVEIQALSISNGIAKIDLSSELEEESGGSCRVESIRAQIEETLKQFPTVDNVELSIDGRTENILQP